MATRAAHELCGAVGCSILLSVFVVSINLQVESARHAPSRKRDGATHFLMKRLPKVATEMALHVLAYNLTREMNIVGVKSLIPAMKA